MPRDQLSPEFTGAAADNPTWNSRQFYSVTRVGRRGQQVLGKNLACPPSIS